MEILIPIDSEDSTREVIEYTVRTYPDASITVLHVLPPNIPCAYGGFVMQDPLEPNRHRADELFEVATETAERLGGSVTTKTLVGVAVWKIVEYADESNTDHIVIGSCGRSGLFRLLYKDVTKGVVSRSPVPVTVVK